MMATGNAVLALSAHVKPNGLRGALVIDQIPIEPQRSIQTPVEIFGRSAASFLKEVLHLQAEQLTDRALDLIFRWNDRKLKSGRANSCNAMLDAIDESSFDEDLLVGFLTSTYAGRHLLPARVSFVQRVRAKFEQEIGAGEADALLRELV